MIDMANTGNVELEMMKTGAGNITFVNDKDIAIDRVETDLASGVIVLTSTHGSFTGVGPTPPARTPEAADVAGNEVHLIGARGNLGTPERPIVIWAPHEIETVSVVSFSPIFLPGTGTISETAWVHFSAFDILTGLAGEQVTQVENLDTIDPAIFTEVHNFNLADISILMPPDQRYDTQQQE